MTMINEALTRVMLGVASLKARLSQEEGQDLIEYAMLGGLIAVAIAGVIALGTMTDAITSMADGIADCIDFSGGPCDPS